MKTFDYEAAWLELALPAFKKLPNSITTLAEEVQIVAADLGRDSARNMIWPSDGGKLRELFDRIDSPTLARGAMVVYYYGHWRPGGEVSKNTPKVYCGWKFSNYADQVLRNRFNIGRDVKNGVGILIHQGKVRVCYASRNAWNWHEVAMADESGMAEAAKIADQLRREIQSDSDRDGAAWSFFEKINGVVACPDFDTEKYMVEESALELRRARRMPKPDRQKLIEKFNRDFQNEVGALTVERDGNIWLVNHDIPIENAIYYKHTGRWCFGWRNPITGDARLELLEKLNRFPHDYDVK